VPVAAEALPELPIWEQAWVWDLAKQGLGGLLVLFLVFGVIKPAFKDMNKVPVSDAQGGNAGAAGVDGQQAVAAGAVSGDEIAQITTGSAEMEDQMNNVRSLVQQDPALVAQVVKNWTASDA